MHNLGATIAYGSVTPVTANFAMINGLNVSQPTYKWPFQTVPHNSLLQFMPFLNNLVFYVHIVHIFISHSQIGIISTASGDFNYVLLR